MLHVFNAAQRIAQNLGHAGPPTIAIDANWVGFRGAPTSDSVSYTVAVIGALKSAGFNVIVVFDPPIRHYTKVASIRRAGERERARADAYHGRVETMRISEDLLKDTLSANEREELEKKRNQLQSKIKSAENKASSQSLLPPDFRIQVVEEMSKRIPSTDGISVVQHCTGAYQADSKICQSESESESKRESESERVCVRERRERESESKRASERASE